MEIPMILNRKEEDKKIHTYKFIKQCNKDLYLYESKAGYKTCFTKFDLGQAEEMVKPPKTDLNSEKVRI